MTALRDGDADLPALEATAAGQALRSARRRVAANRDDGVVVTGDLEPSVTAADVEVLGDGDRAELTDCVLNGLAHVDADDPDEVAADATGWRQPVEATLTAHAVVAWRSDVAEVVSIAMRWPPHVLYTRRGWDAGFEDAVIAAVGELAENPNAYDDLEAFRAARLLTDAHLVLATCSLLGQRGRQGQRFWFEFVRDESLERLAMYREDIDRVAATLADRGALDHDDLAELLGPQVLQDPADFTTGREEPA